ncbi:MAG: exodeoxyribonuclease III [Clostridiales bacterium]|jgi:exodeoxyribonuclease-3|nr:exodeoxyribonuclease III [Clostridiales bacterium]
MRLITWNVNGLRACLKKGFEEFFDNIDADIFCIQETKLQQDQVTFEPEGYFSYFHSAERKGYSGTAVFTKIEPLSIETGIRGSHNDEGRVMTLDYDKFYLVNCYSPNSQNELARLGYRMEFEDALRAYLQDLDREKPVILCGDLNVAHQEIDLKNPKSNRRNAGFSDEERAKYSELLDAGFTDSFRSLYPDRKDAYTWWSYMFKARERNAGWRIDYFVVSDRLISNVVDVEILSEIYGSDHCPVLLELDI